MNYVNVQINMYNKDDARDGVEFVTTKLYVLTLC